MSQSTSRPRPKVSRGLVALVSAIAFFESLFLTALAPLLPEFKSDLDLSTSEAGVLVAMFPLGVVIAVIPTALVSARLGVKPTLVGGLVLLAAASVGFGVFDSYGALLADRFVQGAAGATVWAAAMVWLIETVPAERRGEMMGTALGAGAAGQIMGPLLGGIAAAAGLAPTFAGVTAVVIGLTFAALRFAAPPAGPRRTLQFRPALTSPRVINGVWLVGVPGIILGAISTLGPLQLEDLGWGTGGIATTFGIAAAGGVLIRPLVGRWSDRVGRMRPLQVGFLVSVATMALLALVGSPWLAAGLLATMLMTVSFCLAPGFALLSDECQALGVGQVVGIAVINLAWTVPVIVGSAAGGAAAQAVGRPATYVFLAAIALVGVFALARQLRPAAQPAGA